MPETGQDQEDGYVPFAIRFRAWWDGVEPGAMMRDGQAGSVRRNRLIVVDTRKMEGGDGDRAELRYRLWSRLYGEGFSLPGGQEATTELLKHIDLRKSHTVLDMAAGLGGTVRAAALQFGATVVGLEPDPDMAELGMKLSVIRGVEARAPISAYDPETISLSDQAQAYDVIVMRERLSRLPGRMNLLAQMEKGLAADGRVVIADLLLAAQGWAESRMAAAFTEDETVPWTLGEFQEECGKHGLRIHLFRDETEGYRRLLLDSWTGFFNDITRESLDRAFVDVLMGEAESMKRRIAAIDAGALRYGYIELRRAGGWTGIDKSAVGA